MEANGIAAYILNHFGSYGKQAFAIYKFLMVLVIIVICEIVGTRSALKARIIVLTGITVYFGVVIYESVLIYNYISLPIVHHQAAASIILQTTNMSAVRF